MPLVPSLARGAVGLFVRTEMAELAANLAAVYEAAHELEEHSFAVPFPYVGDEDGGAEFGASAGGMAPPPLQLTSPEEYEAAAFVMMRGGGTAEIAAELEFRGLR